MKSERVFSYVQSSKDVSPRSVRERFLALLFEVVWFVCCRWTFRPFNAWRVLWLKLFGMAVRGTPSVHQRARVDVPWNVTLGDRSCLGDRTHIYSLGKVEIGDGATIAQEAYLCTGTHDFADPNIPLQTAPIIIGPKAFIGARAFIMPGVIVGEGAVIGAGSVVTKDVEPWSICVGNPSKVIGVRKQY